METKRYPLVVNLEGPEVADLHKQLGALGLHVPKGEASSKRFGVGTRDAVLRFQSLHSLPPTGNVDGTTAEVLASAAAAAAAPKSRVEGRVMLEDGSAAKGLTVTIYGVGPAGEKKLGQVKTDDRGYYLLDYDAPRGSVGLQVRTKAPAGDNDEIILSDIRQGATKHELMNLVAPHRVAKADPEHKRLVADLESALAGGRPLAELQEKGAQRDLSLLHKETGWDARLIGFAAEAARLSGEIGVEAEVLYTLFRVGLPTDLDRLSAFSETALRKGLEKGGASGICAIPNQRLDRAVAAFKKFADSRRRASQAGPAHSSFGEMLDRSGLSDANKQKFEKAYFGRADASADLWKAAADAGMPAADIKRLRAQGKLAYLTHSNAALTQALQREFDDPEGMGKLVEKGLYEKNAWKKRLRALAARDRNALDALIPGGFPGKTADERLDAYADDMARRVRISYPTAVVAHKIGAGELPLGNPHHALAADVQGFLGRASDLGYELGQGALTPFVEANKAALFQGIDCNKHAAVLEHVGRVQRLHQITPSDDALKVALELGFRSARDVVVFPKDEFISHYGTKFGEETAALVYRKAEQVSSISYNIFTGVQNLIASPQVFGMSSTAEVVEQVRQSVAQRYPTLESLFGNLDYCECEHCASIFSPAAYLVDLLHFLDPDDKLWGARMTDWRSRYNNTAYPFKTAADRHAFLDRWRARYPGRPDPAPERKPFDVLADRRPDLAHIPLTCENTHTALPYVDVANEIMEYYVVHGSLGPAAAHDTGDAETADLLAEPRHVLPAAYVPLKQDARYPVTLPFDLWLESSRALFRHFEVGLADVLEAFRRTDELDAPVAHPEQYGHAAIFTGSLGLAPVEVSLLTAADPLADWFRLYGYDLAATALAELKSARTLANRLGVTYTELDELVRTRFVNPALRGTALLDKLEVEVQHVFRLKGHAAYADEPLTQEDRQAIEGRLQRLAAEAQNALDALWGAGSLDKVLILKAPPGGCDFANTIARHADGTDATPYDLVRLHFLVRLWRRLGRQPRTAGSGQQDGFSIRELDEVLAAFLPGANQQPLPPDQFGPALRTALVYIAHLETVRGRLRVSGKRAREHLLTLWTNLRTHGRRSLYAELFLRGGSEEASAVFDDPAGNFPSRRGDDIALHTERIQGALGLGAGDIERVLDAERTRILNAGGADPAPFKLTLGNLSLLHRHALLAKGLRLTVEGLLKLIDISGLRPFRPLDGAPLASIANDHAFGQTIRFIELVQHLTGAGFALEDVDYLLQHRFDPVGKHAPDDDEKIAFAAVLALELRRVRSEYGLPADPGSFEDDALWQRIALALPAETVATFRAMWDGSIEYRAKPVPVNNPAHVIDPAAFAGEKRVSVGVDAVRDEQWLVFRGVLTQAERNRLAGLSDSPLLAPLLDDVRAQAQSFFDTQLLRRALTGSSSAGFLDPPDFEGLFGDGLARDAKKRRLLEAFTPYLLDALSRREVVRALATRFDRGEPLIERLLTDANLLRAPGGAGPLLNAFLGLAEAGVTATYLDAAGAELARRTVARVDPTGKPANTETVRYEGYLQVPSTGAYRFYVRSANVGTRVSLSIDGLADPLITTQTTAPGQEVSQFATLTSGVRVRFALVANQLGGGTIQLHVQGQATGLSELDALTSYPQAAIDASTRCTSLLGKLFDIIDRLELQGEELIHVLANGQDFGRIGLDRVPTRPDELPAADVAGLLETLEGLILYERLRDEMAGGTQGLLEILSHARRSRLATANAANEEAALLEDLYRRVAELTRREPAGVQAVAERLGIAAASQVDANGLRVEAPDFARPRSIKRIWQAMQLVARVGIPATAVIQAATPEPDAANSGALRDAVRARFDDAMWRRVAPEIFDPLRQKRRDALVAYLLHKMQLARVEELYEHFLIDPAMEPVVQTSRIQLAIASVQLFIQRCLLNLEEEVDPSAINASHWAWMKRYRVWKAARKLALFPENWLEPEFRDDKTHLFKQLEGSLLQSDVSEDAAEEAFFRYLRGLEEIAHLEIVSLHADEELDPASTALHVLGRTARLPHKYYYRKYQHRMWTPWAPVEVEIEGDHVALAVWRKRLQIFWVTFLDKGSDGAGCTSSIDPNTTATSATLGQIGKSALDRVSKKLVEVQLNWAEYAEGEWSTRESSGFGAGFIREVDRDFDPRDVFIRVEKEVAGDRDGAIQIHLGYPISRAFRVVNRNAPPRDRATWFPVLPPFNRSGLDASKVCGPSSGELEVFFIEKVERSGDDTPTIKTTDETILGKTVDDGFTVVPCNNGPGFLDPVSGGWGQELATFFQAIYGQPLPSGHHGLIWELLGELSAYFSAVSARPFFYQNDEHVFYVEPTMRSTTIREWNDWGYDVLTPVLEYEKPEWWEKLPIEALHPQIDPISPLDPRDPGWVDPVPPEARFRVQPPKDWLANPGAAVRVRDSLLGPTGGSVLEPTPGALPGMAIDHRSLEIARSEGGPVGEAVRVLTGSEVISPVMIGNRGLSRAVLSRLAEGSIVGGRRGSSGPARGGNR